ncbi:FecR domain-containing protein [Cellvibrio sp. ARAG 10.3]|uniref:FecR domain-containing protein n=1 Tax=Cellvibrio sp. ARAG 10.3 TaxID=3451358 RepID=UPI003F457D88
MTDDSLQTEALKAAALWFVQLTSGDATDEERAAWHAWRQQNPAHEYAWQQVEKVTRKFSSPGMSAEIGLATLERPASPGRRKLLQHIATAVALGGLGWISYRTAPWQSWSADYVTAVGEQCAVTLQDGSQLTLNTDSVVDLRFSPTERRIVLHRGEVFINTTTDTHPRPFIAATAHGDVTALGTRFTLRCDDHLTRVELFDGALGIRTATSQDIHYLKAGQSTRFSQQLVETPFPLNRTQPGWLNGILVIDDMALPDFIADLGRYRRGYLIADKSVEGLRVSGAFPIGDTDRVLDSLATTLPVDVQRFTDYWITIKRRT